MKRSLQILIFSATMYAVALPGAFAQKPGQQWTRFKHLKSQQEYKKLPAKAKMIFACAQCKSIATVTKKNISAKLDAGEAWVLDPCPGCDGKITTKFAANGDMQHDCTKCGPNSAFCCCQAGKM